MKVIHIIDSGGYYGAEVMLLNLCTEQIKQGLSVEVISIGAMNNAHKRAPKAIELKLQEAGITCTSWPMRPLPDPRQSLKILRYCRAQNAKVIHSHGYKGNILLGMIPKKMRGIAVVTTLHGYTRQQGINKLAIYQWLDRQSIRSLDAVVVVSPSMLDQIPHKQLGKKVSIIANGIPAQPAVSENQYTSLFRPNSFKVGALGRLSYEKNFGLLIEAISLLAKQQPNIECIIYGEGDQRAALEEMIKRFTMTNSIKLPGYLSNPHAFLQDVDLFINCSITEGMPISILEAMRAETTIAATQIPANAALLPQSQLCQLNPEAMAQIIDKSINTPTVKLAEQTEQNKAQFLAHYTLEKMTQNYSKLYQALQPIG